MDKKTKGSIAELIVAARFMKAGYRVSLPIGENNRYDLVVEREGVFKRVQVKYVTPTNGVLIINCRSSNNWSVLPYTKDEIDLIAAYDPQDEAVYFVPVGDLNRNSLHLRLSETKNRQQRSVRFAKDYLSLRREAVDTSRVV